MVQPAGEVGFAATAHMGTTKAADHMAVATEPASMSTASATAARNRVSGKCPGESRSRSQNNHGLAQH